MSMLWSADDGVDEDVDDVNVDDVNVDDADEGSFDVDQVGQQLALWSQPYIIRWHSCCRLPSDL